MRKSSNFFTMLYKKTIWYIDRTSGKKCKEKYPKALLLLYPSSYIAKWITAPLRFCINYFSTCSFLYGFWQQFSWTKRKIPSFVKEFHVDEKGWEKPIHEYKNFYQFFTRKLQTKSRSFSQDKQTAIIPADGRYLFFPNLSLVKNFYIKGHKLPLEDILQDQQLVNMYKEGSGCLARLSLADYHRFHFPIEGRASAPTLIRGSLSSVHPIALTMNPMILAKNKRMITSIQNSLFGQVLYVEIGATNIGSIHHTYSFNEVVNKGDEKGFFSPGGSSILLLFEKNKILFTKDLLHKEPLEIYCRFGQNMGTSP